MLTKWAPIKTHHSLLLEGTLLLAALPFLLFPNFFTVGTMVAFLIVAFVELVPPLQQWRPWPAPQPFDIILLLWLLLIGLSILVTADPDLTLEKASVVILGIALWRYLGRSVKRPFHWHLALAFFGLLGAGFIGLGILSADWIAKSNLLATLTEQLPNIQITLPGLEDGAAHPNQVAGTLLFYFPLLWSLTAGQWQTAPRWRRLFLLLLTLGTTAVLILTQSRSGWLGAVASLYLLVLLWTAVLPKNSPHKRALLLASGAFTLLGIISVLLIGPERLASLWQDPAQETLLGSIGSLGFRQEVWRWTVVMLQDFPFTGIGLGSFQHVIRRLYPVAVDPAYAITHAHNVFLQTAVDFGLFGLINYLALMGVLLAMLWKTARSSITARPYALGFAASLLAYHVYGLGDVLDSKTNLVIWILYGLITSLHQINHVAHSTQNTGKNSQV